MTRSSSAFTIDWRRLGRLAPRAALAGVLAGWLLAFVVDTGEGTGKQAWGGDYPAFQTAGRIVLAGEVARLYDEPTQQAYQAGLPTDGFLPFLNPPFVAAFYAPLAALPYRTSYALFTLVSLAALAASVRLLAPLSQTIRADPWRAVAATLLFYPVLRSTFGGQNTAIGLLVVCATWRLLWHDRDLLAGVVLGALSYKPQFLLPIAGVLFLAGRYRAAAGVAVSAGVFYAASAAMMGWAWPATWWTAASAIAERDYQGSMYNSLSLAETAGLLGWRGGWFLISAALSLAMAAVALRSGRSDLFAVLALGLAASLLIPPHALYYDVGIALPALLLLADRGRRREAALLWLGAASQIFAPPLPFSPVIVVVVVLAVLLYREIRA